MEGSAVIKGKSRSVYAAMAGRNEGKVSASPHGYCSAMDCLGVRTGSGLKAVGECALGKGVAGCRKFGKGEGSDL